MARIHLVCKQGLNFSVRDRDRQICVSGLWDIPEPEARKLIGGHLFLQERKQDRSYFGGLILDVEPIHRTELAHSDRVQFVVESQKAAKDVKWVGQDHARTWSSGILDD